MSFSESGGRESSSTPASGRFGVISVASGSTASISVAVALRSSSESPLFATITGSTTRCANAPAASGAASPSATARAIGAVPSMPILAVSIRTSANSVSSCSRTNSGGTPCTPVTAWVFCAVSAATTPAP